MKTKLRFPIILLLVSFASVGAVLFTPALPAIQAFFKLTVGQAQFTITAYLIGYALGQLPYGPLANRFGRKPTLYIGLSISVIGSMLCALSSPFKSFGLLIFARFLQALGACVGLKVSFTIIGDVFDQTEATRKISRVLIAFAIMPGVAIAIGGFLTSFINWESCFYFLALFGVFMLWVSSRLPETAKSLDPNALKLAAVVEGYAKKLKNKRLITSALIMGCGTATVYIFASKAPFIGINVIGLSPDLFGLYNLIPPIGMLLGSFLASRLAGHFPLIKLLFAGIVFSFAMTFSMLIPFLMGAVTAWSLFFPMFLIYITESLVFANISSYGLSTAQNKSNASAMLNFINMGSGLIAVLLTEWIYPDSALLLPISLLFFFVLMGIFWMRLKRLTIE